MRCLFTYEPLRSDEVGYSRAGLRKLSPRLLRLQPFPYDQREQIEIARRMARKISIQGIQPKFSVVLSVKDEGFKEVESHGRYILKPQVRDYDELPENEDLTMHLVALAGLRVPWHGLLRCSDGSLSYVIRRFDRDSRQKIAMEDFTQLLGLGRSAKYDLSLERVSDAIDEFCTFPILEKFELYRLVLLSFLFGNEDLHLKNLALVTQDGRIRLSPVYDFVNSTIANPHSDEESALDLMGKKRGLTRRDFIDGFGVGHMELPSAKLEKELKRLLTLLPAWKKKIEASFLTEQGRHAYSNLLDERARRLAE